jgi:hypothetical protein
MIVRARPSRLQEEMSRGLDVNYASGFLFPRVWRWLGVGQKQEPGSALTNKQKSIKDIHMQEW